MPFTWLGFSTASKPFVAGKKPKQLEKDIKELLGGGTQLVGLYFDVGHDMAYVLLKDLGGSVDTKQLSLALGTVEYKKLLNADQADPIFP